MTLEKILQYEFTLSNETDNDTKHHLRRIILEIKSEWKIETIETDFKQIIVSKPYQNIKGQWHNTYSVYFDPTNELLKKFDEFPEALI